MTAGRGGGGGSVVKGVAQERNKQVISKSKESEKKEDK